LLLATPLFSEAMAQRIASPEHDFFKPSRELRIDITIDPADWDSIHAPGRERSDDYFPASVQFTSSDGLDMTVENVGVRLRGNTSRFSQKKSYKLSFNEFESGRKIFDLEKMNLNGEHNDPAIMRAHLSWWLFEQAGVMATRSAHVLIYVNGNFVGVQLNVEHIDEQFLQARMSEDGGYLYKARWPAPLTQMGNTWQDYLPDENDRPYELKLRDDTENSFRQLKAFIDSVNTLSDQDFRPWMERHFNLDSFARMLAVTVLTGSWDDYWFNQNNFYIYRDTRERWHFIPYDFDNSFGVWWDGIQPGLDWATRDIYDWGLTESRPLATRLMEWGWFRDRYTIHLTRLLEGAFNESDLDVVARRAKDWFAPWVNLDPAYPLDYGYTRGDFEAAWTEAAGAHVTSGIRDFILNRRASALLQRSSSDLKPSATAPVVAWLGTLSASSVVVDEAAISNVRLFVEFDDFSLESWPMTMTNDSLGLQGPDYWSVTDLDMGGKTPSFAWVEAADASGQVARSSSVGVTAATTFSGTIWINELMADNGSSIQDEAAENDDWIELYNAGQTGLSLAGLFMSDDINSPTAWALPDTTIEAGGYLVVWADNDPEQGAMHATFKLSSGGEEAALFDGAGVVIDHLVYPSLEEDQTWGRGMTHDDTGVMSSATPGASNSTVVVSVQQDPVPAPGWSLAPIYPNPASGRFRATAEGIQASIRSIELIDITGRVVLRPAALGDINAEGLAGGLYLLRVINDEGGVRSRTVLLL